MSMRVLVVDDSAFMRKLISEIINAEPDMEVVATARNGKDALTKLSQLDIDVVTLDVEMPVMDGLETLRQIMNSNPLPVVMLSSMTKQGSDTTVKALGLGAVDFIPKPSGSISLDLQSVSQEIVEKVRTAAMAKVRKTRRTWTRPRSIQPKPPLLQPTTRQASSKVVVIGSSTGGPKAIEEVLAHIPPNLAAGIMVVQHMPKDFTRSFAERLNSLFPLSIKEAEHGDMIEDGKVLIAPGDYHMTVGSDRCVYLNQEERVMFLRPSIDVTMLSLPTVFGTRILGVVLTGMGRDGAKGMAAIKQVGGRTIAQDRSTSTIYSMPRVVAEEGNADYILPVDRIGESITKIVSTM